MTPLIRSNRIVGTIHPALTAGIVAAAIAAAALPAAAATTTTYSYWVELAETAKKSEVHAGNVVWECRGKYCIAAARGGNVSVRGCREMVRQVGRVVSYRSEIKRLDGDQLVACNAVLAEAGPTPGPQTTSGSATAIAKKPEAPARVTTDELTFTGVHDWNLTK